MTIQTIKTFSTKGNSTLMNSCLKRNTRKHIKHQLMVRSNKQIKIRVGLTEGQTISMMFVEILVNISTKKHSPKINLTHKFLTKKSNRKVQRIIPMLKTTANNGTLGRTLTMKVAYQTVMKRGWLGGVLIKLLKMIRCHRSKNKKNFAT